MKLIKSSFFLCAILFWAVPFAQKNETAKVLEVETDTTELDSIAKARKGVYEAQVKRLKEYERLRKKDPKRFADSLNQLRKQKLYDQALIRISDYKTTNDLIKLKELDLSGARLERIPDFVFEAIKLEVLVLDDNIITELPARLAQLKNLKRIYWRDNRLGNQKIDIPKLRGIEKLDLSGNDLSKLPKIHKIRGIEELVLKRNDFDKIPLWKLRKLKELKELEISRNPLTLDRRWYWLLNNLLILKINQCELNGLHPSFYKMKALNELHLQVNQFDSLPTGISRMKNLTKLSLYKNSLDQLPSDFFDLRNLQVVDLYYNELEVIPADIAQLDSLKVLYLSFNKLYDVPNEIGGLTHLEELYIHHNRISEIPITIGDLDHLRVLHFQNNYVPEFPSQILTMSSLEDLNISATEIKEIPLELEKMDLKTFFWKELEINVNDPDNTAFVKMIQRMTETEMVINPRMNLE